MLSCTRCNSNRLFKVGHGFKVERSEFSISSQDKTSNDEEQTHRFWKMEKKSPFHDPTRQDDAVINICLECGQTQVVFPASDPFTTLDGERVPSDDSEEDND